MLLLCIAPFFENRYASYLCTKQKNELLSQFKDALYAMSASIAAGRQMPKAIEDASASAKLFSGESSPIYRELSSIVKRYRERNESIEDMLSDFAGRSGIEEIELFSNSCSICRSRGGDLEKVCLKSAAMIIEKIEFAEETNAVLAEKKTDTLLLMAMPPTVLFFLNISSYKYVSVLYESMEGRVIATIALFLMITAVLWSLKIMNLEY